MDINLIANRIEEIKEELVNINEKESFIVNSVFNNILVKNFEGESDAFAYYNTGIKRVHQFNMILNRYEFIDDIEINKSKLKGHMFYSINIKGCSTDKYKKQVKERFKL